MIYATKLKELREEKNMSQINLAKILNIDNSLLAKYEKEYEIIPIKHLNTLCNYGVRMYLLITFLSLQQKKIIKQ